MYADILTDNFSVNSYQQKIFLVAPLGKFSGIQIADYFPSGQSKDQETMKTEEFILTYGLGNEVTEIVSLIGQFFQSCKYDLAVNYVDETEKDILQIKIFSKFTPEETAKREWELLGEAIKRIPPEKTHIVSIVAEIP